MDIQEATPGRPEGVGSEQMLLKMNEGHRPLREWALPFIDWKPEMDILDVGCGGGATIKDMLSLSTGSRICGIDYSPDSVVCAKKYLEDVQSDCINIIEGNVSNLPFEDDSFDLVTAVETVYFWPDIQKSLCEIKRVLKNGAPVFLICEADSPERAEAWGDVHCDMTVYYPDELADECKKTGFSNVSFELDGNGYMFVCAYK